jgi:tRNA(His) 5'-end guanylyltransferase
MNNDSLGDRMKGYENIERKYLTRRMPVLIRIDGSHFHSFTKGFQRPFDMILMKTMWDTAQYLCKNVMGCKIAYTQSDEITLLLTDYDTLTTQAWFDKNVQKMVSISASMATLAFNNSFSLNAWNYQNTGVDESYDEFIDKEVEKYINIYRKRYNTALFDSRVFNIPKEEVCNAFIWRQQDATRNAIQMVGQANFSHKQLQSKTCNQIQEMLFQEKSINFNDLPTYQKRGACIVKNQYDKDGTMRSRWIVDENIPIFTQDRDYIEKYL